MDIRLIFILILFIVLMVAFGRNPMEHHFHRSTFEESLEKKLDDDSKALNEGMTTSTLLQAPGAYPRPAEPVAASHPPGVAPTGIQSAGPGQPQVPQFFLQDGRRVFFSVNEAFIMGGDGTLAPLPDGVYTLQTGDTIIMRDGARVAQ